MKILILTQKVDSNDPILGFFTNWLSKISLIFDKVNVLCLEKGSFNLPENISVYSLGKEGGRSRIKYLINFYKYIWKLRGEYDAVFVHMNQEYVILGWKIWFILGKKIYFWRNHSKGSFITDMAVLFSHKVFCTSRDSYTAKFSKTVIMPVGIDTDIFRPQAINRKKNSILFLGRISPVKNAHAMVDMARVLRERGMDFSLDIVGDPVNKEDFAYKDKLIEQAKGLNINFLQGVANSEVASIYASHLIYVNLTPSGSLDKTILEAASSGAIPIVANRSLSQDLGDDLVLKSDSPEEAASLISRWLSSSSEVVESRSNKLKNMVEEKHSLELLIRRLKEEIR